MIFIKEYTGVISSGFHHISIKVGNFDASVKFYTEILGLKKKISWGEGDNSGVMLEIGDGCCLEIFAGGSTTKKPEGAFTHLAFSTTDCDNSINRVRAAGMEITMEPTDVIIESTPETYARVAFFKGLDGENIEFFQSK